MQAYMKSTMPYHGVSAVPLRAICKRVFQDLDFANDEHWQREVLGIWRGAKYREERYAAIELSGHRRSKNFQTMRALAMYEEMITSGAWWDFVDTIAAHRLGQILRADPQPMQKAMRQWSGCDNLWKRRSAILCQLTFKQDTDLDLLFACIEPSLDSKEFFLRKAIGWALRQYAMTDAEAVRRYVRVKENDLSPLSRREALKNISE